MQPPPSEQIRMFAGSDYGAIFSPCGQYRHLLWRRWDENKPKLMLLMLNPSTADECVNDPTVERQQQRAVMLGFGSLWVCNLFDFRATDPGVMKAAAMPSTKNNDVAIVKTAMKCDMVICGWGNHGSHRGRSAQVASLLNFKPVLHCLGVTKTGEPIHPLYVSYAVQPQVWKSNGGESPEVSNAK